MRLERLTNGLRTAALLITIWIAATGQAGAQINTQVSTQLDADALRVGASMADLTAPQLRADILQSPLFVAEIDT